MAKMNPAASLAALDTQANLGGRVRLEGADTALPRLAIGTDACTGVMCLHGAHVLAWQPADAQPVLFQSGRSHLGPGQPIRGGVPVIFPWFGPHPSDANLPMHGLLRTRSWELADIKALGDSVTVAMTIASDAEMQRLWPGDFAARLTATFDRELHLVFEVGNTGAEPFDFEQALHTYFVVGDVRKIGIRGLAGATYIDKVDGFARKTEGLEPIAIAGETDRVYVDTEADCILEDAALGRTITVKKTGSRSTVVWNPWIEKAARMPDFGEDEWTHMVCIETANAAANRRTLEPGQKHEMTVTLGVG